MRLDSELKKLHLGCGKRYIPGWVHIDSTWYPHLDHKYEVHKLDMYADETCGIVYASHVLEYYDWREVRETVLPEWFRVLAPGGTLRISVPDFEKISKLYLAGLSLDFFIGPLFGRIDTGREQFIYHKSVFDYTTLSNLLLDVGFTSIRHYDWTKTDHADVDDCSKGYIPHMDKRGIQLSLNLEATKPLIG